MKILIISDFLYKQILSSRDKIEYIKWNDGKLPSLGGYDAIVIDMTFESKEINDNKVKLLHELKTTTEKTGYLSKKNLILVVVCCLLFVVPYKKILNLINPTTRRRLTKFIGNKILVVMTSWKQLCLSLKRE